MTHTTGPWKPQTSLNHKGLWETIDKRNGHLGRSFYKYDNAVAWCNEQNERALIEAAPDLLAALREWTYKDNVGLPYEKRLRLTLAAIAKATGEA